MLEWGHHHFWLAFAAVFLLAIAITSAAYRRGYFHLSRREAQRPYMSFRYVVGAFGLYLVIRLIFMPILELLASHVVADWTIVVMGWFQLLFLSIMFIALITYLYVTCTSRERQIIFCHQSFMQQVRSFLVGALTLLLVYPWVFAMSLLTDKIGSMLFENTAEEQAAVKYLKSTADYPFLYGVTIFSVVVLVPIMEELLFRGFLQSWLRRYLGRIGAIIVTAFIFTAAHYAPSQEGANFTLLCSLLVLALFLGFLYEKEQTLIAPIGLHALFNGSTALALLMQGAYLPFNLLNIVF